MELVYCPPELVAVGLGTAHLVQLLTHVLDGPPIGGRIDALVILRFLEPLL